MFLSGGMALLLKARPQLPRHFPLPSPHITLWPYLPQGKVGNVFVLGGQVPAVEEEGVSQWDVWCLQQVEDNTVGLTMAPPFLGMYIFKLSALKDFKPHKK